MATRDEYEGDPNFRSRYRETERRAFGDASIEVAEEQNTERIIQSLDSDLTTFRDCIQTIGTAHDNSKNRKELKRLRSVIKRKIADSETKLKEESGKRQDRTAKMQFNKMSRTLGEKASTFKQLLEQDKRAEELYQSRVNTPAFTEEEFTDYGGKTQKQTQARIGISELDQRERDAQELHELERDIVDLRDIQQELAGMVVEQGEDIDRIDRNVAVAQVRVERGTKQTAQAVVLQTKKRKLTCIIVSVLVTIGVIVLVVAIILMAVFIPRANTG